ncbi:MAG: HesA/MoeB/ThiF family protein [Lachnospiraceae bacterium]|nr:HesA/MoeB/ThiF family protein [Lachnospiraceae bacterium]
MEKRFIRNLGAITEDECDILKNKKVFVAGCGGLGGYIAEYLTRIGVGEMVACDGDCFDETNFNRQLLSYEDNIGKNKALEAQRRAKAIVPDISFSSITEFLTEENAEKLISGCDVVMDALDSVKARKILASACVKEGIPLIHGAIEGWFAQVAVVMPDSTILDKLYPDDKENKNKSSLSFTPALCASIQCAEAVKLLLGKESSLKNKVLFADLLTNEYRTFEL